MVDFNKPSSKTDITLHDSIRHAETIWQQHKDILWSDNYFWKWGGQVYKKIDELDFLIETAERFPAFNSFAPKKQKEIMDVYKRYAKTPNEEFNKEDGLCFHNVYLDLKDFSTYEHDKKRINTIMVNYDYDQKAECPLWLDTLKMDFEGDNNRINSLQEFFGYCLSKETRYKKAMFLYGDSDTGKSVLLETLQNMVGTENISFVSLRHFYNDVRLSSMQNKLINICSEIPKNVEDFEEMFKKISVGENIEVSPKYIPQFSFRPFCKLIFAVNEWPRIADRSNAFFTRMLVVGLDRVFQNEEQDKFLSDKLKNECAGILNWSLIGLKRLREQKGFYVTEAMKEDIEQLKLENNPVGQWAEEFVDIKKGGRLIKPEAYQKYALWCNATGHKPASFSRFGIEMFRLYKQSTKQKCREASEPRRAFWPGLKWKKDGVPAEVNEQVTWDE